MTAIRALSRLSAHSLGNLGPQIATPGYDRSRVRAGIAHIGVGSFHRTHQAVFVDRCLHRPDQAGWGIVGIGLGESPEARTKADAFQRQDGLYTVTEFAPDGTAQTRVIGAMLNYLHAPSDPERVLLALTAPDIRIVSLTITEGGYNLREGSDSFMSDHPDVVHDLAGGAPRTVFGFVVEALARRRDAGVAPFTIVSCDNLRHNGDTARKAFAGFASSRDAELAEWIRCEVAFPNSMVDRIAPKITNHDRDRLNQRSGIDDLVPASSESYIQWVMEDRFPGGRPALDSVGVELRDDVSLFETVKGRLLNASHVLMSYPSVLCGHRLVHSAMGDRRIVALLDTFMDQDAIPLLEGPRGLSLQDYKSLILDRFSNPAIGDQLLRIAHDGAAKIPVFHSETLARLLKLGADVRREAFFLACYARYFDGRDDAGEAFEVHEPSLAPDDLLELRAADGLGLLRIAPLRALGLGQHARFVEAYRSAADSMVHFGTGVALERLLGL